MRKLLGRLVPIVSDIDVKLKIVCFKYGELDQSIFLLEKVSILCPSLQIKLNLWSPRTTSIIFFFYIYTH